MIRYAAHALPWWRLVVSVVVVAVLIEVVRRWPWVMWPLQGCAVGLIGAAGAWCLDERAAAVVDAAPRGLAWRTGARLLGIGPVLLGWFGLVWWARDGFFGHAVDVALQGLAAVVLVGGIATWARARGEASPSRWLSVVVVPVAAFLALVRPFERAITVFPRGPTDDWAASRLLWLVLLALGFLLAGAALADGPWRRMRSA